MTNFCSACGTELENPNAIACPNCGGEIRRGIKNFCPGCGIKLPNPNAIACPNCGGALSGRPSIGGSTQYAQEKNSGLAAILSFLFTGLGQIYNGQVGKGIMYIVIIIVCVLLSWLIIPLILGVLFWVCNIFDAYHTAEMINRGESADGFLNLTS
jgi:TM2 domain-containing membrane protein YozV/predicted RNA-binding Zn-ribbon protein involved in translation (DUF1610 family)